MLNGLAAFLDRLTWWEGALLAGGIFLVTCAGSLAGAAAVVVNLPATYFRDGEAPARPAGHPVLRWAGLLLKNVLGALLILVGVLLSLPGIPGQGLLTILIGLMLLNFPGKRRLERGLVAQPQIFRAINGLRARFGKPALSL